MKTAEQMYKYCMDNNYGQGNSKKWSLKHFHLIEESLAKDEEVLMCFIGLHNYQSLSKHDNNFGYAITPKRIIMAQKKVIGQVFQSIAIDNLNDITLDSKIMNGIITIDTIKESFNVCVNKNAAQNINNSIHDILFSLKENNKHSINSVPIDPTNEIIKYKNLLDMGAITQEEYDKKKKELLNV